MIPDEAIEAAAKAFAEHGTLLPALEAALPYLSEAARQPQRYSPTDWPDVPRLP